MKDYIVRRFLFELFIVRKNKWKKQGQVLEVEEKTCAVSDILLGHKQILTSQPMYNPVGSKMPLKRLQNNLFFKVWQRAKEKVTKKSRYFLFQ